MAKKPSLLESVLAVPVPKYGSKSWFEKLEEGEIKKQLRELHAARKAGKLGHSVQQIRTKLKEVLGLEVGESALDNWLKRATPDG
jgi:hypothetical protein